MAPKTPSFITDEIKIDVADCDDAHDVGQEDLDEQFNNQETNIMESAVINASSDPRAVVFTDRHHDGYHRNHLDELIAREQAAFGRQDSVNAQTVMRDVKDARFDISGDVNRTGAAGAVAASRTNELVQGTSCHTDQLVQGGFSVVHDRLCDATGKVIAAVEHGSEEASENYALLQKQVSDAATSTLVGFKDLTALSYQIQGAGLLEASKNAAALSVQATANANAASVQAQNFLNILQVQALTNFNALNVEMVKNAAAAELRAQQIAATAAAKAAECCCELKALIIEQNTATRAQAADFRMRDLEGKLNRLPVGVAITIPPGV